jgi:hypothetical protein
MKQNIGLVDRLIRFPAGILFLIYYYITDAPGLGKDFCLLVALYLMLTSMIGICAFYAIAGINTNKSKGAKG